MVEILISETGGLNQKLLDKTKEFLSEKGRRYFGIAGTSLKNQLDDPKYESFNINSKLVNAGISGEIKTSKILREWMKDKPEVVLIDSISLPINNFEPEEDGEEGQLDLGDTDHLLIIGNHLIIIDSKNWKAKTKYSINDNHEILRGGKTFSGSKPRINQAKYLWEKYYEDFYDVNFSTYVSISSPDPFIERARVWWQVGYKLVNQETLIYFLDKFYNENLEDNDKNFIRVELVAKALTGLVKPYDKFKEKFGANIYNRATGGI